MTSRLDRLFVLLEAGTGPATRRAAARQLGEVQKAHPEELHHLLGRLTKHLRSPAWETRTAASQAVEAILANVPEWKPPPCTVKKEEKYEPEDGTRLRCETFDLERVLQDGASLMGSEGNEYDMEEEALCVADLKDRISRQRQQLNAKLGLDVAPHLGIDLNALYTNEDLCLSRPVKTETQKKPVQELVPSKPLSSREINLAKRKARLAFSKQKSRDCSDEGGGSSAPPTPPVEPDRKKMKLEPNPDEYLVEGAGLAVPDSTGGWGECTRWPLERWSGLLRAQLFSAAWEARHGAASALRELLRARICAGAGRTAATPGAQMEDAHQEWLEDMALRLLCVLALDRFGDFVSDQVVAPVRETCAQTLGVALAQMRVERVRKVCALLAVLATHAQWEARHGAVLGYKYLLAARKDIGVECGAVEQLVQGLEDGAEDVSAAAASALAALAGAGSGAGAGAEAVENNAPRLAGRLWSLLRDQDDLAAPANAYLALLAALCALPRAARLLHITRAVEKNAPKLFIVALRLAGRLWIHLAAPANAYLALLSALFTSGMIVVPAERSRRSSGACECLSSAVSCVVRATTGCETVATSGVIVVAAQDDLAAPANAYLALLAALCALPRAARLLQLAGRLWSLLRDQDDLAAPANAYLALLAALCALPRAARLLHPIDLPDVLPRLWPYLDHSTSSVRKAALQTLRTLTRPLVTDTNGVTNGDSSNKPVDTEPQYLAWTPELLQDAMRHVYQRVLFEHVHEIQEIGLQERRVRSAQCPETGQEPRVARAWYIGGGEAQPCALRDRNVTRARCLTARMLGYLSCYLVQPAPGIEYKAEDESPIDCYVKMLTIGTLFLIVSNTLFTSSLVCITRILQEARDLHAMMKHYKLPVDGEEFNNILRLEQVAQLTQVSAPMVSAMKIKRVAHTLEERRAALQASVAQCSSDQNTLNVSVQAGLAGACANLHSLPDKLNPVMRPLMDSVKKEPSEELQQNSAATLAELLEQLVTRDPCPNNKVLVNLKAFLRCDPEVTPRVSLEWSEDGDSASDSGPEAMREPSTAPTLDRHKGILTLREQQRQADAGTPRRGRPPALSAALHLVPPEDEAQKILKIQRRGATLALFHNHSFIYTTELESLDVEAAEEMISRLQVFEAVCAHIAGELWQRVIENGALALCAITRAPYTALRHMGARALAAMAARDCVPVMHAAIHVLLPALSDVRCERTRCGASEALTRVVDALQLQVVPYIVLLVVPLLGEIISSVMGTDNGIYSCGSDALQLQVVPYIVLLVVPLLGEIISSVMGTDNGIYSCGSDALQLQVVPYIVLLVVPLLGEIISSVMGTDNDIYSCGSDALQLQVVPYIVLLVVPLLGEIISSVMGTDNGIYSCGSDALQLQVVPYIVLLVVPLLGEIISSVMGTDNDIYSCGSDALQLQVVPYIVLLVVPLLGEIISSVMGTDNDIYSCGSDALQLQVVPYIVLLVVPLLGEIISSVMGTDNGIYSCGSDALQLQVVPYIVLLVVPLLGEIISSVMGTDNGIYSCGSDALQLQVVPYIVLLVVFYQLSKRYVFGHPSNDRPLRKSYERPLPFSPRNVHSLLRDPHTTHAFGRRRAGTGRPRARRPGEEKPGPALPGQTVQSQDYRRLQDTRARQRRIEELSADAVRAKRKRDRHFLDKLFNPKTIDDYKIPVPVNADLRSYQQLNLYCCNTLYICCLGEKKTGPALPGQIVKSQDYRRLQDTRPRQRRSEELSAGIILYSTHYIDAVWAKGNRDRHFLDKLFNPKTIDDYKIPVPVNAELRSYQQAGVNWLRFLYEYKLHGVLCDDMGLGKTLQSIVAGASSHYERAQSQAPPLPSLVVCPPTLTGNVPAPLCHPRPTDAAYIVAGASSHYERAQSQAPPLPSLVVCPPTLTGHWVFEVNKFIPSKFLNPLQYVGPPVERERLRAHNNVLELWSLFDFLMPGLLGTERQFTARYSRPILAARDPKATPGHLQAGALACEALHRQVLPFLLRRVKEDVLKELPPKITQDYYCELSPLQRRLYEHLARDHVPADVTSTTHVFQALHYLQNVCNHPKLVLSPEHPEWGRVSQMLAAQRSSLDDIQHAAKLPALKEGLCPSSGDINDDDDDDSN
ncbi:hypothetical protein evm_009950 [Chilo suppressalis]|nr:hypothetical protein evm_009950 [Chilo suppressalis]